MITSDQAQEANETLRYCRELKASEAFQKLFMAEIQGMRDNYIAAGRDVTVKPRKRAEFHLASHTLDALLVLLPGKEEGAIDILKQWAKENNTMPNVMKYEAAL